MEFKPKRLTPILRPASETVDGVGERLDRVQNYLKSIYDPLSISLAEAVSSLGTGASADLSDTPALALASSASAGTSDEASRYDHRHPYPDLSVLPGTLGYASGGTGLTSLGTAYQQLGTNSAAAAMEWVDPFAQYGLYLPSAGGNFAATAASMIGFGHLGTTTYAIASDPTVTTNRYYAVPWVAPLTGSWTTLMFELTTGDAGKVVNFAVYESGTDGYPTNRLVQASGVSLTTTGMLKPAFSSTLSTVKGRIYWIAFSTNSTSAQWRAFYCPVWSPLGVNQSNTNFNFGTTTTAGGQGMTSFRVTQTYAVPPATFGTGATIQTQAAPILGIY